jgi:hypothetical protein
VANLTPGKSSNASVPVTVLPSSQSCSVQVFLTPDLAGANIVAQSPVVPFTSTGSLQTIAAALVFPNTAGTYYVFVAVYVAGVLVGVWTNGTVKALLPCSFGVPTVHDIWNCNNSVIWNVWATMSDNGQYSWSGIYSIPYNTWVQYLCKIHNPNNQSVQKSIKLKAHYVNSNLGIDWIATYPTNGSSYNITVPANGDYQFDSCGIEGIFGDATISPGTLFTNNVSIIMQNAYYEVWLVDENGIESTHLRATPGA